MEISMTIGTETSDDGTQRYHLVLPKGVEAPSDTSSRRPSSTSNEFSSEISAWPIGVFG